MNDDDNNNNNNVSIQNGCMAEYIGLKQPVENDKMLKTRQPQLL